MNRDIRNLIILGLLLFLPGCPALLSALATAAQGAQWISSAVDVAQAGSGAYFAKHPSLENEPKVDTAIRDARLAIAALNAALSAGDAAADKDVDKAKTEALEAYRAVTELLTELRILSGEPPDGGASTDAPDPEPFTLPSHEDIGLSWEFRE